MERFDKSLLVMIRQLIHSVERSYSIYQSEDGFALLKSLNALYSQLLAQYKRENQPIHSKSMDGRLWVVNF